MLYFELGLAIEDYLTEKEIRRFGRFIKIIWRIKSGLGIILKKRIDNKLVYVIPKVNKRFLKKVNNIIKVSGQKQVCISSELFYKEEFISLFRKNNINICDGSWVLKYMLINILDYISDILQEDFLSKEIAILVNKDYELASEYIKILSNRFKIITVVTNNVRYFSKFEDKYLKEYGIEINLVNNYRKSLNKTDFIVNLDFNEKEIKKYNIFYGACFINLGNKVIIDNRKFEGVNILGAQISMPYKYFNYSELFYNFNYLNVYESFIKKKTSVSNILKEIEKDELDIICLENDKGIIKKEDFLRLIKKILDK